MNAQEVVSFAEEAKKRVFIAAKAFGYNFEEKDFECIKIFDDGSLRGIFSGYCRGEWEEEFDLLPIHLECSEEELQTIFKENKERLQKAEEEKKQREVAVREEQQRKMYEELKAKFEPTR